MYHMKHIRDALTNLISLPQFMDIPFQRSWRSSTNGSKKEFIVNSGSCGPGMIRFLVCNDAVLVNSK